MKLCLFSISYAGLWGQDVLPLPGVIAKAAELGYDGVMLAGKRPHLSVLGHVPPSLPTPAPAFNSGAVTARSEPRYRPSLAA